MLKSFLKVFLRSIKLNKGRTAINILGLSGGLAGGRYPESAGLIKVLSYSSVPGRVDGYGLYRYRSGYSGLDPVAAAL
jgi:hypothetical protein